MFWCELEGLYVRYAGVKPAAIHFGDILHGWWSEAEVLWIRWA